ncbi:MAG: hypothetical protein ACE14P_05290 [Methanotrichaceae archaeon]
MSNYLDLVLSRAREPIEGIRPRLPSIFEPIPLSINRLNKSASKDANGISGNDLEFKDIEGIGKRSSKFEESKSIAVPKAINEDLLSEDSILNFPDNKPIRPIKEINGPDGHAFNDEKTDLKSNDMAFLERFKKENTSEFAINEFSKPLLNPGTGMSRIGDLFLPPQKGPRIEVKGEISSPSEENGIANRKEKAFLENVSPGRFQPVESRTLDGSSLLKPALERFKEMSLTKTEGSKWSVNSNYSRPIIKVTIGHINVRAVTKPSQAKKVRQEKTKQSLEDYLKQHGGGNR